jgi:inosine-uridine nucleoside N-ribohydrolase
MQSQRPVPSPKKSNQFFFDSDMGNRIDSALALAIIYGHTLNEESGADVAAVGTTKATLSSAVFYDVVRRFLERPHLPEASALEEPNAANGNGLRTGGTTPGRRTPLPITYNKVGYRMGGNTPASTLMLDAVVDKRDAAGNLVFARELDHVAKAADSVALLRDTISDLAEGRGAYIPDGSGVIVSTGPATNLARLLALTKMPEIISRKVRLLVVAMGRYPSGSDPTHIGPDLAAARRLLSDWPGAIVACGSEIAEQISFPGASIERDFGWAPYHPIVEAYRAFKPMPYDTPAWETAAALYAVRPDAGYFTLSAPGRISIDDSGTTRFEETAEGNHRYLILDESKRHEIVNAMTDLASTEPMPLMPPLTPPDGV